MVLVQVPVLQLSAVQPRPSSQVLWAQHTLPWPHTEPLSQSPSAPQDCPGAFLQLPVLPLIEQTYPPPVSQLVFWFAPVQELVHAPDVDVQTYPAGQEVGVDHFKAVVSQVCTWMPEHCVVPLTQEPVHTPETHVELVHGDAVPQPPADVQVCTPLFEHRV
jgi:hypothetical protein